MKVWTWPFSSTLKALKWPGLVHRRQSAGFPGFF
jgi:hypothetical protein